MAQLGRCGLTEQICKSFVGCRFWSFAFDVFGHLALHHVDPCRSCRQSPLNDPVILFLAFNAIVTCELITAEWNPLAKDHHSLRVTEPNGHQRSTHYLGLPFRYAIPLTAISAALHRFISQSFLLADLAFYGSDRNEELVLQDSYGASDIFSRFQSRSAPLQATPHIERAVLPLQSSAQSSWEGSSLSLAWLSAVVATVLVHHLSVAVAWRSLRHAML